MFMNNIFVAITYPKFLIIVDLVCEFVISIGKISIKLFHLFLNFTNILVVYVVPSKRRVCTRRGLGQPNPSTTNSSMLVKCGAGAWKLCTALNIHFKRTFGDSHGGGTLSKDPSSDPQNPCKI